MADRVTSQMRCYRCVLCKNAVITEGRIETSPVFENPSDVPDQNNCSFGSTSGYVITGGKLLERRLKTDFGATLGEGAWVCSELIRPKIVKGDIVSLSELHKEYSNHGEIPFGGVCNDCLENAENAQIILHLKFED